MKGEGAGINIKKKPAYLAGFFILSTDIMCGIIILSADGTGSL
jgi:hypothetical protein